MKVIIVTLLKGKNADKKVSFGETVYKGIKDSIGYFPDGAAITTALKAVTNSLRRASINYKRTNSIQDKGALKMALGNFCDVIDDAKLYVQKKCNADPQHAVLIANASGFFMKRKSEKYPLPEPVVEAKAIFTRIKGTVLISIKKRPRFAQLFEVYISETPTDEKSWKLIGAMKSKKLIVEDLVGGKYYFFRIRSCNGTGKSVPSGLFGQRAA